MEDQVDQSCFVPEISVSFQKSYYYYLNWVSPVTMLLSVWCFLSNAAVIIALCKSGIKSIRHGLLILCSLTLKDLLWGATIAVFSGFGLKHLRNSQVCEVFSELSKVVSLLRITVTLHVCTLLNIVIISIDRYLAVKTLVQYKLWVTRCRALVVCTVVSVVSITIGTLRQVFFFHSQPINVLVSGIFIIAAAVIIVFQTMTLRLLRRHSNNVTEVTMEAIPMNTANSAIERKLAKTTTYVVWMLALCFIPVAVVLIIIAVTKKSYYNFSGPVTIFLVTICSGINPVLYYRGNGKVKEGMSKLVKCQ